MDVRCQSDWVALDKTFRIALGDIRGNIQPYKGALDETPRAVFLAGLEYDRPWTRDAAINGWNGGTLLFPEVSRNTLLSTLVEDELGLRIGGQYWDAVIWGCGAWDFYQATGDRLFLERAGTALENSLLFFEQTEFDSATGLFRGGGCYADGISAYGERYSRTKPYHDIHFWPQMNPLDRADSGAGVPLQSLSTNCLYYRAYEIADLMRAALGLSVNRENKEKAKRLKRAINNLLWDEKKGQYNYYIDPWGVQPGQEGIGVSFALLFDIADEGRNERILDSIHTTPWGIPCFWPSFPRYRKPGHYGRHSGTVWPVIQGFWGEAALKEGRSTFFFKELEHLIHFGVRDGQLGEVFHPETGEEYGGLQENPDGNIEEYFFCHRQTWSSTAFLRLLLRGVAGISYTAESITISPVLPPQCSRLLLADLSLGDQRLDLNIQGRGAAIGEMKVNGQLVEGPTFSRAPGDHFTVDVVLED